MEISPKYLMQLTSKVEEKIWAEFASYKNVNNYIKKWHEDYGFSENFNIFYKNQNIDLNSTLHNIDPETIFKIAIDLEIETPNYISAVPVLKNILETTYPNAFSSFQNALKQTPESQDLSVGLANSTLESIIKHILENKGIKSRFKSGDTLYDLTQSILKEFSLFPNKEIPKEIRNIGSGLLTVSQNIEMLRSEKTTFHGKTKNDYIIKDPLYAYFIVNAVSTIGLFLLGFCEKRKNNIDIFEKNDLEKPSKIDTESLPF